MGERVDSLDLPRGIHKTRILVSAGDPSGDLHSARLASELLRRRDDLHIYGLGGPRMAAAGVLISHDSRGCSAIGVVESLKVVPRLLRVMGEFRHWLDQLTPHLVVVVDYGAFNLRLARAARELDVPVLYYIPPGSWARQMREVTRRVAEVSTRVATPFPWSAELLQKAGADATFVGHPLLDGLAVAPSHDDGREYLELEDDEEGLALLPGAREAEIRYILPLMLRAAKIIRKRHPHIRPFVSCAPSADMDSIAALIERHSSTARIVTSSPPLIRGSAVGLAKSGTITLEAALLDLPLVVTYAASWLSSLQYHLFAKRLIKYIAMPNILLDELVQPELYGRDGTPERLAEEVLAMYDDPARGDRMQRGHERIREQLGGPGATVAVADMVEEMLRKTASAS